MKLQEQDIINKEATACSVESLTDSSEDDYNKISVPDGGYGWVVVFSSFVFNFCTWGATSGYSVYLSYYMTSDKYETGTDLDYAAIGGLSFGVGLFLAPLFNYLLIKSSAKKVLLLGIVVQNVSVLLAAFATKLALASLFNSRCGYFLRLRGYLFSKHYYCRTLVQEEKIVGSRHQCRRIWSWWNCLQSFNAENYRWKKCQMGIDISMYNLLCAKYHRFDIG